MFVYNAGALAKTPPFVIDKAWKKCRERVFLEVKTIVESLIIEPMVD